MATRAGLFSSAGIRLSASRVVDSILPALQIVVAATAGYAIAHYALGHPVPLQAVTVTIVALGFTRDARPVRVLESAISVVVGIAFSELLLIIVGHGIWQTGLVLFVTLLVARLISPSNAFAVAAGTQSMLVMLLPFPAGGPFGRSVDGLIAGALALVVTALIPRDPRRLARREARRLFAVFTEALGSLAHSLEHADEPSAQRALDSLRTTQPLVDGWAESLDSARAIARISPFSRGRQPELVAQERVLHGMDLATRNLRVISRRIDFLVRDGVPRPAMGAILARLATSVTLLGESIDDPVHADTVRIGLVAIAERLRPESAAVSVSDSAVILMLRPLLVDLLTAADYPEDKARAALPEL